MLNIPRHVGIIMDGNGRWASKRGLPKKLGHKKGSATLEKIALHARGSGIKSLSVYAFSTENWKRDKREIDDLFLLLKEGLKDIERKIKGKNIRIRVVGNLAFLDENIKKTIQNVEKLTKNNTNMELNILVNYGGRQEILHSFKKIFKKIVDKDLDVDEVQEATISENLSLTDVDLVIMTAGRHRLSNFLLWQASYAEFWTTSVLWPDFSEDDFDKAILDFKGTKRNFGA